MAAAAAVAALASAPRHARRLPSPDTNGSVAVPCRSMIASRLATSSGRSTPCTLWSTTTTCKSVPAMQTRLESRRKLHRWRRYTPADHSCCPPSLHAGLVPASSPGSAMHIAQYHAVPPTHLHAVPILQHLELLQVLHHLQAQGRGAGRAARQGSQAGQAYELFGMVSAPELTAGAQSGTEAAVKHGQTQLKQRPKRQPPALPAPPCARTCSGVGGIAQYLRRNCLS